MPPLLRSALPEIRAIDPRLRWTGRRRRDPIYLERAVDEVHDPVLRETGPSVECRLEASIESQTRIGDLDHEGRARGMRLEVILRLAGDNENTPSRYFAGVSSPPKR